MIPPDNYIIFLKFSEQRWIDSLVNGNFSFHAWGNLSNKHKQLAIQCREIVLKVILLD